MDKSNIAFAVVTTIVGVYIAVALVLSRMSGKSSRARNKQKGSGPWTSSLS